MAISLESANKVRQKTRALTLDPYAYYALKSFFLYWNQYKSNADLQFIPFLGTSIDDANGQVLADAACTLYVVYGKKTNTGTDAYLVMFDDATDDTGGATDARLVIPFLIANETNIWCSPGGVACAAGVVAKSYTDFDGTTDTSAGDAPNGFVIIGA
jgi:hypothetical protein